MMAKSNDVVLSERSSVSFFGKPVAYSSKPLCKTFVLVPFKKDDGVTVPQLICIEDKMKDVIQLDYHDVSLSNLRDKGVEPHSLDMIDTNRLGVDACVDALANHILNNASDYVQSSKSE